jgi:type I restriction-modification system DNA methylase subunit
MSENRWRTLVGEDVALITRIYPAWRDEKDAGAYADVPGFCKAAKPEEIKSHGYILTPGRYVGAADVEDDYVPFGERFGAHFMLKVRTAVMNGSFERDHITLGQSTRCLQRRAA